MFERNIRCLSDDKWVDTTCHAGETGVVEVVELPFMNANYEGIGASYAE